MQRGAELAQRAGPRLSLTHGLALSGALDAAVEHGGGIRRKCERTVRGWMQ